jgi:hypothetical protein
MMILILLLLMPIPEQGGKVVLNVGVPAAEFYLDANFVAVTDKSGTLIMENFPAGSFSFSVVKKGYRKYDGSFSIREGEDKQLSLKLERIAEVEIAPGQIRENSGPIRHSKEKSRTANISSSSVKQPQQASKQNTAAGIPVTSPATTQPSTDEPDGSPSVLIPVVLLAIGLCAFGLWIWRTKHAQPQAPAADASPQPENEHEETSADVSIRPAPEFIEELKRREELINAGFVENRLRTPEQESSKEKEIVIVLPKEAFRYEEDK